VLRASLDDFKKPWKDRHLYDRESGEGYYRNAFDYAAVTKLLLEPAGPAGSGECALCSIDPLTQVDHSAVIMRAARDAVLIVDGVFAFRPEINDHWDFRIWLHVDSQTSLRRGVHRDEDWAGAPPRQCTATAISSPSASTSPKSIRFGWSTSSSTTPRSIGPGSCSSDDEQPGCSGSVPDAARSFGFSGVCQADLGSRGLCAGP
jgi:hypothetical protein